MQKQIRTLEGQLIYVNIAPSCVPTNTNPHAFPFLDIIYDLDAPAERVYKIFVQNKHQVMLQITDAKREVRVFPITGRQFLELWHPDWFFGHSVTFTVDEIGLIYASLLSFLWESEE